MSNNFTIYRSSAGSGKTHTLVKEYIKLAISGKDYEKRFSKILAITFTNKAAGEMKERVVRNLYTLKVGPTHKDFNQNYLDEIAQFCNLSIEEVQKRAAIVFANILHNYHLLKITTIDKFTVSLVYSFARDLKIDAEHEIVTDVNEVIDAGIQSLIDQSGKDKELTEMFVDFLGFEMDDGNKFNAKKELRKFCSKVMDEAGFEALELAKQHTEKEFIDACKIASTKLNEVDHKISLIIESIFNLLDKNGIVPEDFYFKGVGNFTWFKKIEKNGFTEILEAPRVKDFIEDSSKRWQKNMSFEKESAIKLIEDEIVALISQLFEIKSKEKRNYVIHSAVRKNAFSMALFMRLHNSINEYKAANSIILLSEFTQLVSNVVASEPAPFIYERLGERVKNLFVDEFQDTSTLQFSNLVPLMENSLATEEFVMIVGDAKQSIYRWRNGNVEQFVNLPVLPENTVKNNPYRQAVFTHQYGEKKLPINYRSLQNIVEFNNSFFEELSNHSTFVSETLTLAYKDVNQEYLSGKKGGYIEFEINLKKKSQKHQISDEDEEENFEEAEMRINFTLQSIEKSLKNGFQYSDIAILVRTHKEGEAIYSGLRKKNIPIVSNQALSLKNSLEIRSIIAFLTAINSKSNSIHFKNFALNFSRLSNEFGKYEVEIAQISKSTTLIDILRLFKFEFDMNVFHKLNLFEQLHYISFCLKLSQNNSFLATFFELVFGFFKKYGSNTSFFLDWWEQKADSFKLQTSQNSNSVKIITIHKAKGLQFPIVILPFINIKIRSSDKYFWLYNVPGYKIKPLPVQFGKNLNDTEWNNAYETEKNRLAFDLLNTLYVAFTRAEEQLFSFISLTESTLEKNPIAISLNKLGWDYNSPVFKFGNEVIKEKIIHEDIPELELKSQNNNFDFTSWFDKLKVSSYLATEKFQANDLRKKGIVMHKIASTIFEKSAVGVKIRKHIHAGLIDEKEASLIMEELNAFYSSPVYLALESKSISQLTEIGITDGNGNMNRPDRVFILPNNESIVIDLKTGDQDPEHIEQILKYRQLLSASGYKAIEGWLYYFKTKEWIKVEQ